MFSSINPSTKKVHRSAARKLQKARYKGFQAACEKYANELKTIDAYLPGWKPQLQLNK